MRRKYIKDFIFFKDVTVMFVIFLISFGFTITQITSKWVWLAIIIGMVTYTITEYLTHRFLFHIKTPKNPFFLKLIKRLHYDHHAEPNDLHLLFLPLWYSLPNMAIASAIVYLITSSLILTNAFATGLIAFFLFYEWTHYVAHRPLKPVTAWGRWMKKVHLWHHFKNENFWYGVTNPTYDILMGTFKNQKKVEKSRTAKNLEAREEYKNNMPNF